MMESASQLQFRKKLISWYRVRARDLPWRRNCDPYRIWISETMLQQTQAATVIPYFARFLQRFPDLRALARASLEEVLSLWSGLGYYRRAKNLHAAAKLIVDRHGGELPRNIQALMSLPGIGRYTAGAILSLAYNLPEPLVDGNVIRVLCRATAMKEDPRAAAGSRKLWALAESLVSGDSPADFNQAIMELGATVCLPREPRCRHCPVARLCQGRLQGLADSLPRRKSARRSETHFFIAALVGRGDCLLILKRDHPTLMTGLWEFPLLDCGELAQADPVGISSRFRSELGLSLSGLELLGRIRHAITYRSIHLQVYTARLQGSVPSVLKSRYSARWIRRPEHERFGMSSLSLKALRLLDVPDRRAG